MSGVTVTDNKQRECSGVLFKNDRKDSDRHPDYKGTATINGSEFRLSAWVKEARTGGKFLSLAFTQKDAAKTTTRPAPKQVGGAPFNDDIPFIPERRG